MLKVVSGAFAAASIAMLGGCASYIAGGDLIRPGEATATIEVVNQSDFTINAVLISACDSATYGLNRLSDGEVIPIGSAVQFTVSAGCWDVAAGSFEANNDVRERINVPAGAIFSYVVD